MQLTIVIDSAFEAQRIHEDDFILCEYVAGCIPYLPGTGHLSWYQSLGFGIGPDIDWKEPYLLLLHDNDTYNTTSSLDSFL